MFVVAAAAAVPGVVLVAGTTVAEAQSAGSIVVRGNRRIEADTVRSYFQPGPGETLDAAKVDSAIKALFATGLFEDVKVSREGGRLVVTVVENAVINRVAFEGNSKVKDDVLTPEIQSKPRGPFNRATVQADVQRILDIYRRQGRNDVRVDPKTISLPNGRVDLVFEITEGDKTKIARIDFVGNNAYSDSRLRDVITTSETNWLSWLKSSDVYDPDRLNADMELLRRFYLNHGYADFRVVSSTADLDRERNAFFITITVEEGERYRFGTVDVESSVPDVDAGRLKSLVRASQGSTYSAEDVEKSVEALSLEIAKSGYAFAQVRPRGSRDYQAHTVSVVFSIDEGPRAYIERINIRGNTRTRDYVVRREFDIGEGDAYNQALLDRGERRLKNLGFFKTVHISTEPGSAPDRVIVNVDVDDQPTGEFSVSGGYSTSDGFIGEVSVGERNFLGRGQYVKATGTFGERTYGGEFNFTEPYFLGRRISAGFDAFYKYQDQTQYSSYFIETFGGALRSGFQLTDDLSFGLNYQAYDRRIRIPDIYKNCLSANPAAPNPASCLMDGEASIALRQAEGETITSQVGYALVFQNLDNVQNPTQGWRAELRQDFAGLGGDSQYIRTAGDIRYYQDLPSEFVGILHGQAGNVTGWGGKSLRILDHLFKGPELVRGFEPSGLGPRDIGSPRADPLGGTIYFGASAELQFPLFGIPKELGLKGAVFADAGTLYGYKGIKSYDLNGNGLIDAGESVNVLDDKAIRSSVGASLLWNSPLGPLRFDYAYVLTKGAADRQQAFRFSGGARF
jgi:outer membrane protein insertion porin family